MLIFVMVPCMVSAKENQCSVTLPVQIEVTGDKAKEAEEFEIVLKNKDVDAPMPEVVIKTTKGAGEISFGPMNYNIPEDYQYEIVQKKGQDEHWVYDDTKYEITVRVVTNADGELVSKVWAAKNGSLEKCEKITFVNHYETPAVPTVPTSTPQTGDSSSIRLYVGMMAASLFSMLMILCMGSRHFKRMK